MSEFSITEDHRKLLREAVFVWIDGGENGIPYFHGYSTTNHAAEDLDNQPYQPLDRYTDMIRILGLDLDPVQLSEDDQAKLDKLHNKMGRALGKFLEEAQLALGDYTYPNYLKQFPKSVHRIIMPELFRTWERYGEWRKMPVPLEDNITFHFTEEHLKLLRAIRIRWQDGNFGVWGKRPYGSMTYFELDMAEILGMVRDGEFSKEQLSYLHGLHTDLLYAIPVLLKFGDLPSPQ